MKKNNFKFIYIIFVAVISFCIFSNEVKANYKILTKEITDNSIYFMVKDDAENGCYVKLEIDAEHNPSLYCMGSKVAIGSNSVYTCEGVQIKFNIPLDTPLQNFTGATVGVATETSEYFIDGVQHIVVKGLNKYVYNSETGYTQVVCSSPNYILEYQFDSYNKETCKVEFYNDSDENIIMEYGTEKSINPKKGFYNCYYAGHNKQISTKFYLRYDMNKGDFKGLSGCPKDPEVDPYITKAYVQDSTEGDSEGTAPDFGSVTSDMPDPDKVTRKSHITVNNIFQVVTNKITCTGALSNTLPILRDVFKYIRIGAILLFLVLTSFDYVKAIADSDQNVFNKANKHMVTRTIILIAVLILPSIINLVLAIVQLSNGSCGIS